ncbi:MAG: tyrosine-type recombinase/integrase [Alphaproteobacteria bacterium]|nr:tyrosine-type recombinase/integrase [Alphaproteobacteria bacterium]
METVARLIASGLLEREDPRPSTRTMHDLLDLWLEQQERRRDLSPQSVKNYTRCCRHAVAWLGELRPDDLGRLTLERYRNQRLGEGAAPRTIQQELIVLRMAWRWAGDAGLIPDRALPSVKIKVQGYVANHHTPSPADAARVIALLDGEDQLAAQLLATTGARVSEVTGLKRCDVDPRTRRVTLRGKTGARVFPLPEPIFALVADRIDGSARPLFDWTTSVPGSRVRVALQKACLRLGVPVFTPHGLRRMVVDQMIRSGVDVSTAASLTGHSVEVMLRHYRKVSEADRVEAVAKAGLGVLGGKVIEGPWAKAGG